MLNMEIKSKQAALNLFEMLGIKDVSSKTQVKNGTTVYELPIKDVNSRGDKYAVRYATYTSGMVRNVSPCNSSCWQINKRSGTKRKYWNSTREQYYTYTEYNRILIHHGSARLVYLANYILKNNYRKGSLFAMDEWTRERISENHHDLHQARINRHLGDEVTVIVNGHRYNLS